MYLGIGENKGRRSNQLLWEILFFGILKWRSKSEVNMLDIFITSRVRRKILVVFAKYPDFKTHVRALSKLIHEDPGNIQRELKRLEKGNFLIVTKKGNTTIYQTNKQFPILKELQGIVIKSKQMAPNSKQSKTIQ